MEVKKHDEEELKALQQKKKETQLADPLATTCGLPAEKHWSRLAQIRGRFVG
jgi:hypothetical protein